MIDNEVVTIGFSNSKGESMVFLAEKYVVIERSARKLGCTLPIVKSKLPPTFHYKWCESLISNKLNIGKLP